MPRPLGEPLQVGDVWHATCGRVYSPHVFVAGWDPECSEHETALLDWLDMHGGEGGDPDMTDFCAEQRAADAADPIRRELSEVARG